jgi:hypothetical protein
MKGLEQSERIAKKKLVDEEIHTSIRESAYKYLDKCPHTADLISNITGV